MSSLGIILLVILAVVLQVVKAVGKAAGQRGVHGGNTHMPSEVFPTDILTEFGQEAGDRQRGSDAIPAEQANRLQSAVSALEHDNSPKLAQAQPVKHAVLQQPATGSEETSSGTDLDLRQAVIYSEILTPKYKDEEL